MNTKRKTTPSPEGLTAVGNLTPGRRQGAGEKRRLGHYAVTWKDGKPVVQGEDAPGADDDVR